MRLKVVLVLVLTSFCASQKFDYDFEELSLECVFGQMSDSYGCNAKNLVVNSRDCRIDDVSGNHKPNHGDGDVVTFYAFHPKLKYIPKRLGFTFENLKTIAITKSDLSLIEFRDFKNMKKLQKLYLFDNQIEKIPFCVFKYVENLEIIDLSGNRIKELNEDTFANLPNLQQLIVNDNELVHLESGLFRNNVNLKKISIQENSLAIIEINFMKVKNVELVDLRFNPCIDVCYGCIKGLMLRDFQNITATLCESPVKIC